MVFTSSTFLLVFLPVVLILYYGVPYKAKNYLMLVCSLIFYSWGENYYIIVLICSILANYFIGLLFAIDSGKHRYGIVENNVHIAQVESRRRKRKIILWMGIVANLAILSSFKYANFIVDNINWLLQIINVPPVVLDPVHLPVGISFFTFQALSYLIDAYKQEDCVQTNPVNLALYISLFPQLIAGPIVRYRDISKQLTKRIHSTELMASGIRRFVFGLSKKVLIADTLGEVADSVFGLPASQVSTELSWLGIVCYTLQIYYDFSGYSDMAIGLGRMFGFKYRENFNYPYISTSVKEFWQRWHISLSSWFKDYLYIPLGGNRVPTIRIYFNLMLVFLMCGLWHGASWNFIIWGLIHGGFLILERIGFASFLASMWKPFSHLYTLLVVMFAWVFFRSEDLGYAFSYLQSMLGAGSSGDDVYLLYTYLSSEVILALTFGAILAGPVFEYVRHYLGQRLVRYGNALGFLIVTSLLISSLAKVSAETYSPFIYFRF